MQLFAVSTLRNKHANLCMNVSILSSKCNVPHLSYRAQDVAAAACTTNEHGCQ
jgi:hypothetical protein